MAPMDRRESIKHITAFSAASLLPGSLFASSSTMNTRKIPSSNEPLPVVGVGTWQTFDVGNDNQETAPLKQVLTTLIEKGGKVIDSSPMYGRSEEVTGKLSDDLSVNNKLFIATKVWTSGKENGIRQMNESFRFLSRSVIDLMQVHNLVDVETHLKTLRSWREQRKVRYVGITHYTESAYPSIERILKSEPLDFLQINYSLLSRKAEERILPLAQERQVAVLVNRPYEEGSLFNRVRGKELPAWAGEFDCTSWGQFFLKFILSNPAVTCVIPGTSKPHHMADNAMAGYGSYPTEAHRKKMIALISG